MRRTIFILIACLPLAVTISAQTNTITLERCFSLATQNFPMTAQKGIIDQITDEQIKKINTTWQPQANINMQATYQSEVTEIPISFPGLDIPTLSKDQYKATLDITQTIYDGGLTHQQRSLVTAAGEVEKQKSEVEIYKLHEKISQLYFAILLADKNIALVDNLKSDLQSQKKKIMAGLQFGTATNMQSDMIDAELIKADQKRIEVNAARATAIGMLAELIGTPLQPEITFEEPAPATALSDTLNERPELKLYDVQESYAQMQTNFADAPLLPRVGLFVQGGYGRPGLNMLNNDFAFYYIGGVKLSYNLWNGQSKKYESAVYQLNKQNLDIARKTFVLNSDVQTSQYHSDMQKLGQLIESDQQLITLRNRIKNSAAAQVENGTLSTEDYITYLNDETEARINLAAHQIQLLQAQTNYLITLGKIK